MKLKVLITLCFLALSTFSCLAQATGWKVDPTLYDHSMVVVGTIKLNKEERKDANNYVGAFINGECRGIATPIFQKSLDKYAFYLMVYNNVNNGKVSFKFFDSATDSVYNGADTLNFIGDTLIGNVNTPFYWSDKKLKKEAFLSSFSIPGEKQFSKINDTIKVYYGFNSDVNEIKAVFTATEGASVWVNNKLQVSGESANNFNDLVKYTVLSENGQNVKNYWIKLIKPSLEKVTYKVYPNPATGYFYIEGPAETREQTKFMVVSMSGKIQFEDNLERGMQGGAISLATLAPGIYHVKLTDGKYFYTRKLIVGQ